MIALIEAIVPIIAIVVYYICNSYYGYCVYAAAAIVVRYICNSYYSYYGYCIYATAAIIAIVAML